MWFQDIIFLLSCILVSKLYVLDDFILWGVVRWRETLFGINWPGSGLSVTGQEDYAVLKRPPALPATSLPVQAHNTNSLAIPPTIKEHFSGRFERCLPSASGTPRQHIARDRTRIFPCTRLAKLPEPPPPPPSPVRSAYLAHRLCCSAPRGPRRNRKGGLRTCSTSRRETRRRPKKGTGWGTTFRGEPQGGRGWLVEGGLRP